MKSNKPKMTVDLALPFEEHLDIYVEYAKLIQEGKVEMLNVVKVISEVSRESSSHMGAYVYEFEGFAFIDDFPVILHIYSKIPDGDMKTARISHFAMQAGNPDVGVFIDPTLIADLIQERFEYKGVTLS